jgi:plasmid maintenance system antidote protein VapI
MKPWAKYSPSKYWEDGTVRVVAARCHECASKRTTLRYPAYREQNRERLNAYNSAWNRKKRAALRADRANNAVRMPATPLQTLLWEKVMEMEEPSWFHLAEAIGVPDRSIRRVLVQENVSLNFADKVCTGLGSSIYELWPHLQDEEAARRGCNAIEGGLPDAAVDL